MEKEIHTKIPEGERPIEEVLWDNIEDYRYKKRMSISKLCGEVNYSTVAYFKAKKNKTSISLSTIQNIAYVLEVKTLDLFEDWSEQ